MQIASVIVTKLKKLFAVNRSCAMIRKVLLLVALIVVTFSLIGCQTTKGVGEDIKWVGEKGAQTVGQE